MTHDSGAGQAEGGLTMSEYISRKAAIAYIREQSEECQKAFEELGGESGIYADAYNDLAEDFYSIPAADVVPVVRCKDCEHAERYERADGTAGYYCGHPQNTFTYGERWDRVFKPAKEADDFCSYGERKDGADHMEEYND